MTIYKGTYDVQRYFTLAIIALVSLLFQQSVNAAALLSENKSSKVVTVKLTSDEMASLEVGMIELIFLTNAEGNFSGKCLSLNSQSGVATFNVEASDFWSGQRIAARKKNLKDFQVEERKRKKIEAEKQKREFAEKRKKAYKRKIFLEKKKKHLAEKKKRELERARKQKAEETRRELAKKRQDLLDKKKKEAEDKRRELAQQRKKEAEEKKRLLEEEKQAKKAAAIIANEEALLEKEKDEIKAVMSDIEDEGQKGSSDESDSDYESDDYDE